MIAVIEPGFSKCSLAQDSNLGGQRAKKSIASSSSPLSFRTCHRLVHARSLRNLSEHTFVHVLLFLSLNQNVIPVGSQRYFSIRLFVIMEQGLWLEQNE